MPVRRNMATGLSHFPIFSAIPSALRLRSGTEFLPVTYFPRATADGVPSSFPNPGLRFAAPGAISFADLRFTYNPFRV